MALFWLGVAWLGGIAVSDSLRLLPWQWAVLASIAAPSAWFHRRDRPTLLTFLLLAVFFCGALRMQAARARLAASPLVTLHPAPRPVELEGVVFAPPERRDRVTVLLVRVNTAALAEGLPSPVRGAVAVLAPAATRWRYGDRVRVRGVIGLPSGRGRLSPESLARAGVTSWIPQPTEVRRLQIRQGNPLLQILFDLRTRAESAIRRDYPDPQAALLTGILLGDETRIPDSMRRDFAATGTSHIVAISGFNLTLLTGALLSLTGRWLGARRGVLVSAAAIAGYTALVGAAPPVTRAAVTALLALAARRLGRVSDGLASLAFSGVALTGWNPLLIHDVGFQLSFAATLGLVLYSQRWSEWFGRQVERLAPAQLAGGVASLAGDLVWSGLAAQATTLPITVLVFRRLPWISLLANPVVLPVQPALMALGGLSAILSSIWEPLGRPVSWIAWVPLTFTHHAVRWFASIPSGALRVLDLNPAGLWLYLAVLLALTKASEGVNQQTAGLRFPRLPVTLLWAGMLLMAGVVWRAATSGPDGRLHVSILDTGGESILIESSSGRFVLVGGGPSPVALAEALGERLPALAPRLDWVVIRSAEAADTDGLLSLVQDVEVGGALVAAPPGGASYRAFLQDLSQAGRPVITAQSGHGLDLGGGASLLVLASGEGGGTLLLQHGDFRFAILPAEMPIPVPGSPVGHVSAAFLPAGGDLAHNSRKSLAHLDPIVALLSVEAGNRYGLPPPELLAWLEGRSVLRTDERGWIELISDGESLSVSTQRP